MTTDSRTHKVKCHFGLGDYFKFYNKDTTNPKDKKIFNEVLKDYLKMNQELISIKAYIFMLPQRMGRIEMRKSKKEVFIDKEGNVVNKLVPNWKETRALWEENAEAKLKKIIIRYVNTHTQGYVFRLRYIKNSANFKNKSLYKMQLNREMRRATSNSIITKKVDAFLLIPNR